MSLNASNNSGNDSNVTETTFEGEYNAFGVMGKTTSDPTVLVWLKGHEGMKFGIHHPEQYAVAEVFGWLVNNVLSVPFGKVPEYAEDCQLTLAIKRSPTMQPEYIDAGDVEAWS